MVRYIRGTRAAFEEAQAKWSEHRPNCAHCESASNPCAVGAYLRENAKHAYNMHHLRGTRATTQGYQVASGRRGVRREMARWSAERLRKEIKTFEYLTTNIHVQHMRNALRNDTGHLRMLRNALRFRELDGGKRRVWRCDFCGKNLVPINGATAVLRCGECKDR